MRARGVARRGSPPCVKRLSCAQRWPLSLPLVYVQGALPPPSGSSGFACADQALLREIVPTNRKRTYDMRHAIEILSDADAFFELRRGFAQGMISGLTRIGGRPLGVLANSQQHLGGADGTGPNGSVVSARLVEKAPQ